MLFALLTALAAWFWRRAYLSRGRQPEPHLLEQHATELRPDVPRPVIGRARSDFGSLPTAASALFKVVRYF